MVGIVWTHFLVVPDRELILYFPELIKAQHCQLKDGGLKSLIWGKSRRYNLLSNIRKRIGANVKLCLLSGCGRCLAISTPLTFFYCQQIVILQLLLLLPVRLRNFGFHSQPERFIKRSTVYFLLRLEGGAGMGQLT